MKPDTIANITVLLLLLGAAAFLGGQVLHQSILSVAGIALLALSALVGIVNLVNMGKAQKAQETEEAQPAAEETPAP